MQQQNPVLTVTQLNRQIRSWLEHEIGQLYVEGEVSTLTKPSSGHYYFTLKDATAQVRCVFFRNRHTSATPQVLQAGQQIIVYGQLSLYEARGDYQLIVEQIEPAGEGDLFRQFELLKTKLASQGLFDVARKKQLPRFPTVIGIITSSTAAALRDILTTLERRYPIAPIIIYPSDVQGAQAPQQLIAAIRRANLDNRCDVLILARGGGSIEDLWAFNNEQLAYAITESHIPIISGVGHETDFTIADFVADYRAATPTAAAETISPDQNDLLATLESLKARLHHAVKRNMQREQLRLQHDKEKISSPAHLIRRYWQTLDYLQQYIRSAMHKRVMQETHHWQRLSLQLNQLNPVVQIQTQQHRLEHLHTMLAQIMRLHYQQQHQRLQTLLAQLHIVSPLATLDRGYAIASIHNRIIFDCDEVNEKDAIKIKLSHGALICDVINKIPS